MTLSMGVPWAGGQQDTCLPGHARPRRHVIGRFSAAVVSVFALSIRYADRRPLVPPAYRRCSTAPIVSTPRRRQSSSLPGVGETTASASLSGLLLPMETTDGERGPPRSALGLAHAPVEHHEKRARRLLRIAMPGFRARAPTSLVPSRLMPLSPLAQWYRRQYRGYCACTCVVISVPAFVSAAPPLVPHVATQDGTDTVPPPPPILLCPQAYPIMLHRTPAVRAAAFARRLHPVTRHTHPRTIARTVSSLPLCPSLRAPARRSRALPARNRRGGRTGRRYDAVGWRRDGECGHGGGKGVDLQDGLHSASAAATGSGRRSALVPEIEIKPCRLPPRRYISTNYVPFSDGFAFAAFMQIDVFPSSLGLFASPHPFALPHHVHDSVFSPPYRREAPSPFASQGGTKCTKEVGTETPYPAISGFIFTIARVPTFAARLRPRFALCAHRLQRMLAVLAPPRAKYLPSRDARRAITQRRPATTRGLTSVTAGNPDARGYKSGQGCRRRIASWYARWRRYYSLTDRWKERVDIGFLLLSFRFSLSFATAPITLLNITMFISTVVYSLLPRLALFLLFLGISDFAQTVPNALVDCVLDRRPGFYAIIKIASGTSNLDVWASNRLLASFKSPRPLNGSRYVKPRYSFIWSVRALLLFSPSNHFDIRKDQFFVLRRKCDALVVIFPHAIPAYPSLVAHAISAVAS
ncbi:hypothetical protein C8R47DRAFT_1203681, partial [Mycena vitilis]